MRVACLVALVLLPLAAGLAAAQGSLVCRDVPLTCQTTTTIMVADFEGAVPLFPASKAWTASITYTYNGEAGFLAEGDTPASIEVLEAPPGVRVEPLQWVVFLPVQPFAQGQVTVEEARTFQASCIAPGGGPQKVTIGASAANNGGFIASSATTSVPVRCSDADPSRTDAAGAASGGPSTVLGLAGLDAAALPLAAAAGAGLLALARARRRL